MRLSRIKIIAILVHNIKDLFGNAQNTLFNWNLDQTWNKTYDINE